MKKARFALIAVALGSVLTAQTVTATHWASRTVVDASQSQECAGGTKLNFTPESGVAYPVQFPAQDGTLWAGTITFTISGDTLAFQTDSDQYHFVTSLLIKGGPDNAVLYTYAAPGVSSDEGLTAPTNAKKGTPYGVSHICLFLAKKSG